MGIMTIFFCNAGINGKSKNDDSSESEEEEEENTPKTKKVITTPQTFPKAHVKVSVICVNAHTNGHAHAQAHRAPHEPRCTV